MVAIFKLYGEILARPFEVAHTEQELHDLSAMILRFHDEVRVVLEATGIYHLPVVHYLKQQGIFVCVINQAKITTGKDG
ncbi:hypothetical protein P22_1709 [Propionispora sp. 2/2-37]|nr:hypothetical protein P22_1709 [Propionispora sp. 2/2-37]